jgi:hypothetical protein
MTTYTFCINGEYKTVEAEAIKEAGIEEGDACDLVVHIPQIPLQGAPLRA